MEKYYFIQQDGIKKGPLKLSEIQSQKLYSEELVWRSDDDKWKKAKEFEELGGIYIIKPPLTPLEIEKTDFHKNFLQKILPNVVGIYFFLFLIMSISSFIIANNSWEKLKKSYVTNKAEVGKRGFEIEKYSFESLA